MRGVLEPFYYYIIQFSRTQHNTINIVYFIMHEHSNFQIVHLGCYMNIRPVNRQKSQISCSYLLLLFITLLIESPMFSGISPVCLGITRYLL